MLAQRYAAEEAKASKTSSPTRINAAAAASSHNDRDANSIEDISRSNLQQDMASMSEMQQHRLRLGRNQSNADGRQASIDQAYTSSTLSVNL